MTTLRLLLLSGPLVALLIAPVAVQADEVPLTREEMIVSATNTVAKGRCSDGRTFESVHGSDGTVKDTIRSPLGNLDGDEGRWSIADSAEGLLFCYTWSKREPTCWRLFKEEDRYVSRQQGGNERTCWWTLAPKDHRPWAFLGTRRIVTGTVATNLDLYRALLPTKFEMPDEALVIVAVAHYYDVTLPLVPYREGFVLLQCKYEARRGWYVLTMPVDDQTANDGGRSIGFNKYVADKITLEKQSGVWIGRVVHTGKTIMEVTFAPRSVPKQTSEEGDPLFNLVPLGQGPGVYEIGSSRVGVETTITTNGSATVKTEAGEPWSGLLNPDGKTTWAVFQESKGDSVLTYKKRE